MERQIMMEGMGRAEKGVKSILECTRSVQGKGKGADITD